MRSSTEAVEPYENLGEPRSVLDKEKRAKFREAKRLAGLKYVMQTPDGRAWVWHILSLCEPFACVHNGNSRDYFNNGLRFIGVFIFNELRGHCRAEYDLMEQENSQ